MEDRYKFVEYEKYCNQCKFKDTPDDEEPCDECLTISGRLYSHKPEKFEKEERT
jgi:hypothetical protein